MTLKLSRLSPTILCSQLIENPSPALLHQLGIVEDHSALGLMTADQDDALYIALDEVTKHTDITVCFAKSFYAGSLHTPGPFSGDALGIIHSHNIDYVKEALWKAKNFLDKNVAFMQFSDVKGPPFLAHVISECGTYLAQTADIPLGCSVGYFIAPPLESFMGLDAALKTAHVSLQKHFLPPTETNFGGGFVVGTLADVEAAREAFVLAIHELCCSPLSGIRRPAHTKYT